MIELKIFSFPRGKDVFFFEDASLIPEIFDIKELNLGMAVMQRKLDVDEVYHNNIVEVKKVETSNCKRICRRKDDKAEWEEYNNPR